jgi:hypothetical protein
MPRFANSLWARERLGGGAGLDDRGVELVALAAVEGVVGSVDRLVLDDSAVHVAELDV